MQKKLVIVTGASSGIGAAIARLFVERGYSLGLIARNKVEMEKLKLPNTICLAADITDCSAVQQAITEAENTFGPVDCLINNAGFAKGGEFTEVAHADHAKMVEVNLSGVINAIEVVLPGMRVRKAGTIINMSSVADHSVRPKLATYAATKAAVKSLGASLRAANAQYGIRICNLAPAKVDTPMLDTANINDGVAISAGAIAETALWIYQQPPAICVRDLVIAPTYYES